MAGHLVNIPGRQTRNNGTEMVVMVGVGDLVHRYLLGSFLANAKVSFPKECSPCRLFYLNLLGRKGGGSQVLCNFFVS